MIPELHEAAISKESYQCKKPSVAVSRWLHPVDTEPIAASKDWGEMIEINQLLSDLAFAGSIPAPSLA